MKKSWHHCTNPFLQIQKKEKGTEFFFKGSNVEIFSSFISCSQTKHAVTELSLYSLVRTGSSNMLHMPPSFFFFLALETSTDFAFSVVFTGNCVQLLLMIRAKIQACWGAAVCVITASGESSICKSTAVVVSTHWTFSLTSLCVTILTLST